MTAGRPELRADRASACGKVILLGEHAVVHGVPALAAGLPGALELTATPLADPRAPIELSIPAWNVEVRLVSAPPSSVHPVALAAAEVLAHCDGPLTGYRIDGEASIPCGAGLGSSAALTVALARLALGDDAPVDDVIEASLAGERVFHGSPSGVDSAVAARGGAIRFVRGSAPTPVSLTTALPLVVLPTGIERRTGDLVARVGRLYEAYPDVVGRVFEAIAACVETGHQALSSGDLEALGRCFDIDHGLLVALGVGHPRLDELCAVARKEGALGAKLTGAGGGGCAIALAPSPEGVLRAAAAAGCPAFSATIEP